MSHADQFSGFGLGALAAVGPDARAFMQSQLTLDLAHIDDGRLYPAAWCSPNGRVETILLIALEDQRATLVLPKPLVAATLKRARMFSIGRQVTIEGGLSALPCEFQTGQHPGRRYGLSFDGRRALQVQSEPETGQAAEPGLPDPWLRADIGCGMPWILPATSGMFLPQMLGLESLGGLSYKKGCFPGQEVIARLHYRGRVKRRIARFDLQAELPPSPGVEFELAGKTAVVLYAARGTENHPAAGLAVVSAEVEDGFDIRIGNSTGALVSK